MTYASLVGAFLGAALSTLLLRAPAERLLTALRKRVKATRS
jgi:hypothetical protein